ncbi:MAG: type VI secretion system baseplate subunit TssG [Desulfohalobiaceae bacterium]|nr:type VI secretion system baseplate subunit TssG [Desulfohalobiaceae bacterium]
MLKEPKKFSFFQVIRLLKQFEAPEGNFDDFFQDKLRITPFLSLAFPDVDVKDIHKSEKRDVFYNVTATFLGLYGPASPLPTYYTEELLSENFDEKSVKKDFLDIFNDPVFKLFYKCWSKYKWSIKLIDEKDKVYKNRLLSLLGLGSEAFRQSLPERDQLLRYLGLFTQFPRSAYGLRVVLRDLFCLPEIRIRECVPRTVQIPQDQRCLLGLQGSRLGQDSYLGREIRDMTGKIRVEAGNLDRDEFHALLPDSENFRRMKKTVDFYCVDSLEVDLSLGIRPDQVEPARLGEKQWSTLGYNAWIFSKGLGPEKSRADFQLLA